MHGTGTSLAIMTLLTGGTVVLTGESFDPAVALDTLESHRASVIAVVGDAFMRPLLEELDRRAANGTAADLSSVPLVMCSGAMLSAESKQGFLTHAPQSLVVDTLAASEAAMGSSITTAGGGPSTTTFNLRPGTRVLDDADADIEPGSGQMGRVAVPSDNPIGYFNDPVKTAKTFRLIDDERYSLPGDWAIVEGDGTIRLLGRGSQCINTGGEKVFPEEVEEALKTHPAVMDALVFGVDDEKWGQRIEAVVSLHDEAVADEAGLRGHVRTKLADYKAPKRVLLVDTVPRAPNGKADSSPASARRRVGGCASMTAVDATDTTCCGRACPGGPFSRPVRVAHHRDLSCLQRGLDHGARAGSHRHDPAVARVRPQHGDCVDLLHADARSVPRQHLG